MSNFKLENFQNANLQHRIKVVDVSGLPDKFFVEGAKKEFTIRQLSGNEVAICNEAVSAASQARAVIERLLAGTVKEKALEILAVMGFSEETREEIVRGSKMLEYALIDPKLPHDQIIRMAEFYPVVFKSLYHAVIILTGEGADAGE